MSGAYNKGVTQIADGTIDLLTTTLKVMLVDDTFVYEPDDYFVDDVVAYELSGTGYTGGFGGSGRKTLTSKTVTQNDAGNKVVFDAADLTWAGINAGDIGGAVIIRENSTDGDSVPIFFLTLSPIVTTNGGDFLLVFNANGICAFNN